MQPIFIVISKIVFWVALLGSYVAAVVPQKVTPHVGELSDKWTHILAFVVLTLLLKFAYKITSLKGFFVLFAFGVWIEVSQYFTLDRSSEFLDIAADATGIGIGLLLYWFGYTVVKYEYS